MPPPPGMNSTSADPTPHLEDTARPIAGPFFCALTSSSRAPARPAAHHFDLTARPRAPGPRAPGPRAPGSSHAPPACRAARSVVHRRRYPCCSAVPWESHITAQRGLEVLAHAALAPCARRMRHGPSGGPERPGPRDIGSDRHDRSELAARPDRRPTPGGPRARAMFRTNNYKKFDMTLKNVFLMLNIPYRFT
jgi:hypothetical protein